VNRTLLLARTFFTRFFENDLMPPGLPQVQLVIWSVALLASPGLIFPARFAAKYLALERSPVALAHAMLFDRLVFVTMTMTAAGLVALVIWDGVFPDRRDARILGALPLPGRVQIAARLLALAALAAMMVTGVNMAPSLMYGLLLGAYGGASNSIVGVLAHFIATSLAGIFVFTVLIAVQGVVLNLGGRRASDRIAVVFQIVFVVALLQMIFFLPRMSGLLTTDLQDSWLRVIPSVWFLGLYDVLGGRPVNGAGGLAAIALLATAASTAMAAGLFMSTHARLQRRALEAQDGGHARWRIARALINGVTTRVTRHAASRAIFEFTLRTLARSRTHRLLLSMYVGVALALVASALVPLVLRRGFAAVATPSVEMLSAPLVLNFFTLVGMRVAIAIPVEPRANWMFRLREPTDRVHTIDGVAVALLLVGVVPSVGLAAATAAGLWGVRVAVFHAGICGLMGWLLTELLLMRLDKMPFTCSYLPGRSRIGTLWPLYLNGFIAYCYVTAAAELRFFFARPSLMMKWSIVLLAAIILLIVRRRRMLRTLMGLRFQEEDPDAAFAGFQLSEGFAAATDANRRLR
jgi:hypothetical protein